ncbi:unnamed protein product, partial [Musa textilis]
SVVRVAIVRQAFAGGVTGADCPEEAYYVQTLAASIGWEKDKHSDHNNLPVAHSEAIVDGAEENTQWWPFATVSTRLGRQAHDDH